METIRELQKAVTDFRDARDWKQFHTPKDLAISISLEAAELLEVFQWSGTDVNVENKRAKIEEELADVIMYCLSLADVEDMDVGEIVEKKLRRNNEKYPVEKAYGNARKYTELLGKAVSFSGCRAYNTNKSVILEETRYEKQRKERFQGTGCYGACK